MKSYTDISQSKKLAEILPLESADMVWEQHGAEPYVTIKPWTTIGKSIGCHCLSCWSLAALLGVLPQSITKYIDNERCQKTFHLNLFRSYYYCVSYSFSPSISNDDGNNTLYCIGRDNWVDACYEMILKLHEVKML